MKKKQRCFLKRFAALVAALMLCSSLCVPAFASNNASTKKWVIVAEDQRRAENGELTTYFKLSPYYNGALYAAPFQTTITFVDSSFDDSHRYDVWMIPTNYPDWWRSDIPLGGVSYVEISDVTVISNSLKNSDVSSVRFVPVDKAYSFTITSSRYSNGSSLSLPLFAYPYGLYRQTASGSYFFQPVSSFNFSVPSGGFGSLQGCTQYVYSPLNAYDSLAPAPEYLFYNTSSSRLAWCVLPVNYSPPNAGILKVTAVLSYWVDAFKLPAGLQVGDEFPADTDAFDQLRDDLIEQFPEASQHIENGKSTLTGWNDTETVDTDVASIAMSALNGMFQNLGQFLFIVSLMVFGAVVLRMFIRKAVGG